MHSFPQFTRSILWGNLLEWEQFFLGGNFIVRGQFSGGQFPSEAIILGGNCPGDNYPGDNHPGSNYLGANYPGVNFSSGAIVLEPISCNRRWLVKSLTFFKIFICNTLLQLFTTSVIITAAITVVPFYFQGQFWGWFTSTKNFFECCLIKGTPPEVFFNKIWNIHRKIFF